MKIKVENTRIHKIFVGNEYMTMLREAVPVTDAKLVLIQLNMNEKLNTPIEHLVSTGDSFFKPILISLTEKIEDGDYTLTPRGEIMQMHKVFVSVDIKKYSKILALPEHLPRTYRQAIVAGRFKDGDMILIECEEKGKREDEDYNYYNFIKFDESNHITLHKAEEKMIPLSKAIECANIAYGEGSKRSKDFNPEKWFEKNI